MKVLVERSLLLELLEGAGAGALEAEEVVGLVEHGKLVGSVSVPTLVEVADRLDRALDRRDARNHIRTLLRLLDAVPVDRPTLERAHASPIPAYRDAIEAEAARSAGAAALVTGRVRDFRAASIPVLTPAEARART